MADKAVEELAFWMPPGFALPSLMSREQTKGHLSLGQNFIRISVAVIKYLRHCHLKSSEDRILIL